MNYEPIKDFISFLDNNNFINNELALMWIRLYEKSDSRLWLIAKFFYKDWKWVGLMDSDTGETIYKLDVYSPYIRIVSDRDGNIIPKECLVATLEEVLGEPESQQINRDIFENEAVVNFIKYCINSYGGSDEVRVVFSEFGGKFKDRGYLPKGFNFSKDASNIVEKTKNLNNKNITTIKVIEKETEGVQITSPYLDEIGFGVKDQNTLYDLLEVFYSENKGDDLFLSELKQAYPDLKIDNEDDFWDSSADYSIDEILTYYCKGIDYENQKNRVGNITLPTVTKKLGFI